MSRPTLTALAMTTLLASFAAAQTGTPTTAPVPDASRTLRYPLAVRFWGQGYVTIETWWNHRLAIDPYALDIGYDDPGIRADVVVVTHDHADHANTEIVGGSPTILRGLDGSGEVRQIDMLLDRPINSGRSRLRNTLLVDSHTLHAVRIRTIESRHDDLGGTQRGRNAMVLIEVDGVRVLHAGDLGQHRLLEPQLRVIGRIDVLLLPVGGVYTLDGEQAAMIVAQLRPRLVIPIHYKTEALTVPLQPVDGFLSAMGDETIVRQAVGNTLALSAAGDDAVGATEIVLLRPRPWTMPAELAALFRAKESAAQASGAVFSPLTTSQMNHRPANGTHTPRWNTEHMAGRELGFFSSIYAGLDPAIDRIDLNPKQMPDDYVAAQPNWDGAEEARRIERVQGLVRRFAYLLDGMEMHVRPPRSPWTLQGLLRQMTRHYAEHTANVVKKFDQPDWPRE